MVRRLVVSAVGALVGSLPLAAVSINVNSTADVIADDGMCTLREAVIAANEDSGSGGMGGECPAGSGDDIIVLGAGTFELAIPGGDDDRSATGDLDVLDNLVVQGAGPSMTIIDGKGIDRVFDVDPFYSGIVVSIGGVRIQGGAPLSSIYKDGGGIANGYGQLSVTDCVITDNLARDGGGIWSRRQLFVSNTVVHGNTASAHGGGLNTYLSTLHVSNSTIVGNTADGDGGGIATSGGTVEASTIHANTAGMYGGGIHVWGTLQLLNASVSGNIAAEDGGGLSNWGGIVSENSTISGNTAEYRGGGVENYGDFVSRGSTIADNYAGKEGDAVFNYETLAFDNTIIDGGCAGPGSLPASGGGNLESPGDTCGLTHPNDQTGVSAAALNLAPLQDNGGPTWTHLPLPPSAAIDHGVDTSCLPEDQRGVPRPQDGDLDDTATCDVGSVEVLPCQGPLVVTVQDQTIDTPMTIEACREILLGPNLWVDWPADVTLQAGETVVFRDDVSIGHWAEARVIIRPLLVVPSGAPVADFDFFDSGLIVAFQNKTTGEQPIDYLWDFGDGSAVSTQESPVHVYDTGGSYIVTLTATNFIGSDSTVRQVAVRP